MDPSSSYKPSSSSLSSARRFLFPTRDNKQKLKSSNHAPPPPSTPLPPPSAPQFAPPPRFLLSTTKSTSIPLSLPPASQYPTSTPRALSVFKSSSTSSSTPIETIIDDDDDNDHPHQADTSSSPTPASPLISPLSTHPHARRPRTLSIDDIVEAAPQSPPRLARASTVPDSPSTPSTPPRTPKRRRVSLRDSDLSSPASTAGRIGFSLAPEGSKTRSSAPGAATHRFILPLSPSRDDAELPVPFSPHRHRARDFVPGGWAAAVREWALRAVAGVAAPVGASEREFAVLARVREVRCAGEVVLMRGTRLAGGEEDTFGEGRFVLPRGNLQVPGVGEVVGLRKPIWEVEFEKEEWVMGPEWKILSRPAS